MSKATTALVLDEFHFHEVLDRCDVIAVGFDLNIINHPVIKQDKELKSKAKQIAALIGELYQELGMKRFYFNTEDNGEENKGGETPEQSIS